MTRESIQDYLINDAPVLFFRLDREGRILDMNRYTRQICGDPLSRMEFKDIILDFTADFDLKILSENGFGEQLFSIATVSGFPQSYLFVFKNQDNEILAFGHQDHKEIEAMRTEFNTLNRELGNLTRKLHKKNAQLQYALDHVKTLQGIIPICMHCHKIRDEKQIWDRLEKYLTEHTHAELSHGICPDCIREHYPDLLDDDD
jgi:PAS domain-containing protein